MDMTDMVRDPHGSHLSGSDEQKAGPGNEESNSSDELDSDDGKPGTSTANPTPLQMEAKNGASSTPLPPATKERAANPLSPLPANTPTRSGESNPRLTFETRNVASPNSSPIQFRLPPTTLPVLHQRTSAHSRTRSPHMDLQNQPRPNGPTQVSEKNSPQGGPPDSIEANNPPGRNHATTAKNPGSPRVAEQEPGGNETPTGSGNPPRDSPARSPADQSAQNSHKSDIESLYASPSPEKPLTELEPIELDSDPDFEMMEQMLLSHRGPSSQSQPIKKESTTQSPAPLKNKRPLKRQRSRPPQGHTPSQAPTHDPQTGSGPVKRPRVKEPQPSDLAAALNDRRKHPDFWDLDGTVVLQVDEVLFRVMRSTLSKASPWFQRLFSEDFENLEIMAGCPVYTIEENLSHLDFANLLRGLENGLLVA